MRDKKEENMKKYRVILLLIVVFGISLRFWSLNRPLVGNHEHRAVAYGMMARNAVNDANAIFKPSFDLIIGGEPSFCMLEIPYAAYMAGYLWKFTNFSIDFWGRLISLVSFVFSIILFYGIVKKISGSKTALIASFVLAVSPISVILGQSFQMEYPALTLILGSLYLILEWEEKNSTKKLLLSGILFGLALLLRLQYVFMFLLLPFVIFQKQGIKSFVKSKLWLLCLVVFLLPAAWYCYGTYVAVSQQNVMTSVYDQVLLRSFPHPVLFKADFYKVLLDNVAGLCFTPILFPFFLLGIFIKSKSRLENIFYVWLLLISVFFLVLPGKIYDLNYYLLPLVLPGAFFIAKFIVFLLEKDFFKEVRYPKIGFILLLVFVTCISARYFIYPAYKTPEEFRNSEKVIKEVKEYVPEDAKIIVSDRNPHAFLYYCDRKGWIIVIDRTKVYDRPTCLAKPDKRSSIEIFEDMREEGADYFVTTELEKFKKDKEFYDYVIKCYPVVKMTDTYFLFDIRNKLIKKL